MNLSVNLRVTIKGTEGFSSACFSEDGQAIVTNAGDEIQCWDATTGERLNEVRQPSAKNKSQTISMDWNARGPDRSPSEFGFRLSEGASERELCFISEPFPDYAGAVTSPDGRYVAIGYQDGRLRLETLPAKAPIFLYGHNTSGNNHRYQNSIEYLEFDNGSNLLISMAEDDDRPLLWDLRQGWQSKIWNQKPAFYLDEVIELNLVTNGDIGTFRFSPVESKFVCTHRAKKIAQVWDYSLF